MLLVSGHGATSGGGLAAVQGGTVTRIDSFGCTGLAYDGRRLARMLRCPPEIAPMGEVVVYDERGVLRYQRLDKVAAAHDVAWDGDNLVVVSAWHNAVQWFAPSGELIHEIRYPGPYDAWHINCLARRDGEWYATVFANFGTLRVSSGVNIRGAGKLLKLQTGQPVIEGLSAPHSPRWVDGMWVLCNSHERELLAVEAATGRIVARVPCGIWTRGLAYDDEFFYAGGSNRHVAGKLEGGGEVVVVDRRSWQVVDRLLLPFDEVYELLVAPASLLPGLQRGFDVNPHRAHEIHQRQLLTGLGLEQPRRLWPSGDPLRAEDFRCSIACEIPASCIGNGLLELPVKLTNRSESFFTTAPPAPIFLSYRWLHPVTGERLPELKTYKTRLPRTVLPHETIEMTALVPVPNLPGPAILRLTLLQEGVAWFDEQDPANGIEGPTDIQPPAQPGG